MKAHFLKIDFASLFQQKSDAINLSSRSCLHERRRPRIAKNERLKSRKRAHLKMFKSAPDSSRNFTICKWPNRDAMWSALQHAEVVQFTKLGRILQIIIENLKIRRTLEFSGLVRSHHFQPRRRFCSAHSWLCEKLHLQAEYCEFEASFEEWEYQTADDELRLLCHNWSF